MRPAALLVAMGVVLGCAIALVTGLLVQHLYGKAVRDTEHSLSSLAMVLADQADRTLQSIELVQQTVLADIRVAELWDENDYVARMSTYSVHESLKAQIAALPQLNAVTIVDQAGNLINFSRYWPIPRVNVADRDYFKALTDNPKLQTFLSVPITNRGDGVRTIYIARKVLAPDKRFLGLVLGAIELGFFERFYKDIVPESDYVVSLLRSDGYLLVRYPARPEAIGRYFSRAAFSILNKRGTPTGVLRNKSPIDGKDRIFATHSLSHYPIGLTVSRTARASLALWRQQAAALGATALVLELGLAGLVTLVWRQLRNQEQLVRAQKRRRRAEERARVDRELRDQYTRFGTALDHMSQGLCMFDSHACLVVMNAPFARMYSVPETLREPRTTFEAIDEHLARTTGVHISDPRSAPDWEDRSDLQETSTVLRDLADGRSINVAHGPTPEGGWICTHEDITERKQREAEIAYLARHDMLTGLPNRVRLREYMNELVAKPTSEAALAVLYLDLDGFKGVNDMLGHTAGDMLLRSVAQRLHECTRGTDLIARLGGDEFAVVQSGASQPADAIALANRLVEALSLPIDLDGQEVVIGTSIGVAVPEAAADAVEELLRSADIALYAAKAAGRGTWRLFEATMYDELQRRRILEHDLRRAFAEEQFELYYQPLVEADTGELCGFEALLRWRHPTRGIVKPDEFVHLAEETGLIRPIGDWVLQRACTQAATWPEQLKIAVNLSPVQFLSGNLAASVEQALLGSKLKPERLELEITETVLLADNEPTLATLHRLRSLGVRIAMDDFGTGYSSLSYLRSFPFDKIKMDRSLLHNLEHDPNGIEIVRAVVGLCRALDMAVLAEGIETETQLSILRGEGCNELQGYLFSAPVPSDEVPELMATWAARRSAVLPA